MGIHPIKRAGITYLQHLSQKNLSSAFKVSVELKFLRQLVMELFCSMSRLRSKNVSSLSVTVSHLRHLVSFVNMPYKEKIRIRLIFKTLNIYGVHKHAMGAQAQKLKRLHFSRKKAEISPGSNYEPM